MEVNIGVSGLKVYFKLLIMTLIVGMLLFLPAGSLMYWPAWLYCFACFIPAIIITAYFLQKNPAFIARRMLRKEKEVVQKVIMRVWLSLHVAGYLISGCDYRYHWSAVPFLLVIIANIAVFAGQMSMFFVFRENNYASSIIQVEQEQQVITTGPYAIVRHPMYTGIVLIFLFTPFALGSYWALIPFLLCIPVVIFRLINEETLLLRDLPGYKDYCAKTRYRLLPMIW